MVAPMRVRKLDFNGDMQFGHGERDFYVNVPEAPAQCVLTRFVLWQGEWFLDRTAGTPWNTKVLGKYTGSTRDPVLRARALGTQGILGLVQYYSYLDRDSRFFSVQMRLSTLYGDTGLIQTPSMETPS